MAQDPSDSAILDTRFPGYAWMPRWTRRYWTPSVAASLAVFVFSAGVWWGTFRTTAVLAPLNALAARASPDCQRNCLVTREDIAVMASHVNDVWTTKQAIDAEMAREAARREAAKAKRR